MDFLWGTKLWAKNYSMLRLIVVNGRLATRHSPIILVHQVNNLFGSHEKSLWVNYLIIGIVKFLRDSIVRPRRALQAGQCRGILRLFRLYGSWLSFQCRRLQHFDSFLVWEHITTKRFFKLNLLVKLSKSFLGCLKTRERERTWSSACRWVLSRDFFEAASWLFPALNQQ